MCFKETFHARQVRIQAHTARDVRMSALVALYNSHQEAGPAIRELQRSGLDLQNLSVVGRDYYTEEGVVGTYSSGGRMEACGKTGSFWGEIWGLLSGSAFFLIPGLGPVFVAGPMVGWITRELDGAAVVGGLSALGAALYGIGVPAKGIIEYESQIRAGKVCFVAHGSHEAMQDVKLPLTATGCQGMSEYAGRS
jgi:hypothetical protein